jgi:HSP20 family protein
MSRIVVLRQAPDAALLQRELEDMLRRQWGRPQAVPLRHRNALWQPDADVFERDGEYVVMLELAGMRGVDINVVLTDDALFISGERPELHPDGVTRFHQLAITEGPFRCAVVLPGGVDEAGVEASYDDGMLYITLPKRPLSVTRIAVQNNE